MKLNRLIPLSIVAIAASFSLNASAQTSQNIYAECGIGGAIFENDLAAAISNIIWDLGTTAVISGVSSPESCGGTEAVAATFIYETYADLSEETVKGDGEHVAALLDIAGCSSMSQAAAISAIRSDYASEIASSSFAEKTQVEKAEGYYNIFMEQVTGDFSAQCNMS